METTVRQTTGQVQLNASAGQHTARAQRPATRFILQSKPRLIAGLRIVPAAMLLMGVATMAPGASATGCGPAGNIAVSGGTVTNETDVRLSADGGVAVSDASGGNNNVAVGGNGGFFGSGGDATAGNGGVAQANANGGMIDLDDINSGGNSGNAIAVQTAGGPCGHGPSNVAVSGGTVTNETTVNVSADGGTAISDASGGNGNIAVGGQGGFFGDGGSAAAGNGGVAVANANGGIIAVGDINSGNNRGNTIAVRRLGGWFGRLANVIVSGGMVSNSTTVRISADGGTAIADASGGNGNVAVGGNGGILGDGGNAAAGNGGVAVANANGGAVTIGNINSGGNSGNTILVDGAQGGNVVVDGGTVTNETTITVSADGGTAVSDASGGNDNAAVGGTGGLIGNGGDAAAGNGGVAVSEANGGSITIGDVNSGENVGNTIVVGG